MIQKLAPLHEHMGGLKLVNRFVEDNRLTDQTRARVGRIERPDGQDISVVLDFTAYRADTVLVVRRKNAAKCGTGSALYGFRNVVAGTVRCSVQVDGGEGTVRSKQKWSAFAEIKYLNQLFCSEEGAWYVEQVLSYRFSFVFHIGYGKFPHLRRKLSFSSSDHILVQKASLGVLLRLLRGHFRSKKQALRGGGGIWGGVEILRHRHLCLLALVVLLTFSNSGINDVFAI